VTIVGKLNDHFRVLWEKAGYASNYGSAAVVPPPGPEWRRLYHLCPAEFAISNVVFNRVKISLFGELNDPFELLAYYRGGENHAILGHKRKVEQSTGLLCFSADWTNPVLWSHYAAKHRGICLGFDVDRNLPKIVNYRASRLGLKDDSPIMTVDSELAKLLLLTKFKSWEYENEWRVSCDLSSAAKEGNLCFYELGDRIRLAEVIVGSLCDISFEKVRDLVEMQHPEVNTIKARLALNSFNTVPDEDTVVFREL
jgi:hypothetical protein